MADIITTERAGGLIEGGDNDWRVNHVVKWAETGIVTATSEPRNLGGPTMLDGLLTVEALTGTSPTLTVVIETSPNGSTGWVTAKSYTQATGATSENPLPFPVHRFVRIKRTYGGTVTAATVSFTGLFMK